MTNLSRCTESWRLILRANVAPVEIVWVATGSSATIAGERGVPCRQRTKARKLPCECAPVYATMGLDSWLRFASGLL